MIDPDATLPPEQSRTAPPSASIHPMDGRRPSPTTPPAGSHALSPLEREVAALIAGGLTDDESDRRLGITPGTTATYVEAARCRLGCRLRVQADRWAVADRLVRAESHPLSGEDSPPCALTRAVRITRQASPVQASRPTLWRRLVAALVYDNRLQPRPAGARAVEQGPPRLRYLAGGVEIDLELGDSSLTDRVRLLGQVAAGAADLDPAWVAVDGPSGRHEAPVDRLGQFALDGLAHGPHRLEVRLVAELIEIPELGL